MSNLKFQDLEPIYRALRFAGDGNVATIHISDSTVLDALNRALADEFLDDSGISLFAGEPDSLVVGQMVSVSVSAPRSGLGKLARNLGYLLQIESACLAEPKRYYLIDECFANGDITVPENVTRYRKLLAFVALIKQCADYVDEGSSELIFIRDGKFSIPITFSKGQLDAVDLSSIDRLLAFFVDDTHKEQKLTILTSSILSLVEISALRRRFSNLLTEIDDLVNNFTDGYKLFIADFSYDKVRDEFEAAKVEYSGKIHKVFAEIQNQLLTVPIATVIVATQMKAGTDDSIRLANTALIVGSWIFAVIFCLLCYNQHRTLSVLAAEIRRQEDVIKEEYETVAAMFENIFAPLHARIAQQRWFLGTVVFLLLIGLVAAHAFYWKLGSNVSSLPSHAVATAVK
jgi:hypothetical protein